MSSCISDGCAQQISPVRRIRRDLDPNYENNIFSNNTNTNTNNNTIPFSTITTTTNSNRTKCVYIFDPEHPSEEKSDVSSGANKMGSKSFNSMSIISPLYSFLYGEEEELAHSLSSASPSYRGNNFMTTSYSHTQSRSIFNDIVSANSPFSGNQIGQE